MIGRLIHVVRQLRPACTHRRGFQPGAREQAVELGRSSLEKVSDLQLGKAEFAKTAGFSMYFATQFGFDPQPFIDWEATTSAKGIDLPIHVGLPGPASLRQLAKFAMLCGVGASMRMLTSRTSAMANLLSTQAPDEMVTALARHKSVNPQSRFKKVHFFAFGGVVKTARWANAVISGRFVLNSQATGFRVEDVN